MRKIVIHNHLPARARDGGPGSGPQPGSNPNHQVFHERGDPRKPASEQEARMLGGVPPHKKPVFKVDPEKLKRAQEQAAATRRLMGGEDSSRDTWYHDGKVNGYYILRGEVGDKGRWIVRNGKYDIVKTASSKEEAVSFANSKPNGGIKVPEKKAANDTMPVPKSGGKFVYDTPDDTLTVEKRGKGFYGMGEKFDFTAANEAELVAKLTRWGAKYVGVE
jgi:hypothetical protein